VTPAPSPGWRARARALFAKDASLSSRTIGGAALLLMNEGYTSLVRLLANLIMTRLLYPEAFGLMLIVNLVMAALEMLSDVGVRGAVIVRQKDVDTAFIDTAWTMLAVRGALLTTGAIALAHPLSVYYEQPQLFGLIVFASLGGAITGFTSPYEIMRARNVRFGRVVAWRMGVQTVSLALTIVWLLVHPTVWALAGNRVIAAVLGTVSSHFLLTEHRLRLRWDPRFVREIFSYGKWVFVSTAMTFLARQGDSIVISKWITAEQLGLFSIAASLALLVQNVTGTVNSNLLLPVYSELRKSGAERFARGQSRVKIGVMALALPFILVFALAGRDVIALLYDPRYHAAGWILEVLSVGGVFFAMSASASSIMLAFGDSYRHMWLQFFRFLAMFAAMSVGGYTMGFTGLVWGSVAAQAIYYPLLAVAARKYCRVDSAVDIMFMLGTIGLIVAVWMYRGWPAALQ
jgi:O-antigen/teichoic acid export membrane protein